MRALIIGYGSIGQRHMRNLRELRPDADVIVLRRDASQAVDGASVVSDLDAAINMRPDLAVLATPSAAHIHVLIDLILAGVPTYVEKPVVTTAEDVALVHDALARRPGIKHVTGFNLRLLPSLRAACDLVQRGALGNIARASFTAGQWLPDWRNIADFRQSYSTRKSEGGGVIFDLSHELDAARFLLGEVSLDSCLTMHLPKLGIDAESAATMLGRAERGSLVSVNVDYVARRPIRRYELVGDEATLIWDLANRRLELHSPSGIEIVTEKSDDFDVKASYVTAMSAFLACALEPEMGPLQSLEDGLRSTELAIAASMLGVSA